MEPFEKFTENFQKSWDTHMEAFGPILGPAFMNNFEAKLYLNVKDVINIDGFFYFDSFPLYITIPYIHFPVNLPPYFLAKSV